MANGQLLSVRYTIRNGVFEPEKPAPWAEGRVAFRGPPRMFDLHPDGNRVVLAAAPSPRTVDNSRLDKMVLILNFFDELRRLAPK